MSYGAFSLISLLLAAGPEEQQRNTPPDLLVLCVWCVCCLPMAKVVNPSGASRMIEENPLTFCNYRDIRMTFISTMTYFVFYDTCRLMYAWNSLLCNTFPLHLLLYGLVMFSFCLYLFCMRQSLNILSIMV